MFRKLFRTALKAGLASVDLLDTLAKRGEAFVYGEADRPARSGSVMDQEVDPAPEPETDLITGSQPAPSAQSTDETIENAPLPKQESHPPAANAQRPKAPPLCLKTIVTKRTVCLNSIGKPAVLIFHGQKNADEAAAVNAAIQERFYPEQAVFVANIVPLRVVPSFLRRVAEQEMEKAYHKGVRIFINGKPGARPEEVIYIFPDWKNEAAEAFGLGDTWQEIGVVVLDETGGIIGMYQGKQPARQALELLKACNLS